MTDTNVQTYQVRAVNDALTSENRIHSDEIARRYGFSGALVSGVAVLGHLVHPLVEAYGEDWLGNTAAEVKFLKPAYEDDLLAITTGPGEASGDTRVHTTRVHNEDGSLLAVLNSSRPGFRAPVSPLAWRVPAAANPPREPIHWDRIILDQAAQAYPLALSADQHRTQLQLIRETLPLFHQGSQAPLHPYVLLKECNQALMRLFILPAWIHVGSKMRFRRVLRVGDPIQVHTVPVSKWERKGHQFITLYIAMSVAGEVALEVEHTAIFRIAAQDSP